MFGTRASEAVAYFDAEVLQWGADAAGRAETYGVLHIREWQGPEPATADPWLIVVRRPK